MNMNPAAATHYTIHVVDDDDGFRNGLLLYGDRKSVV